MDIFGKVGNLFSVNSADRISRDTVEERMGGLEDTKGRIPWGAIVREYGSDAVPGRVTIRKTVCALYAEITGRDIGIERARQLLIKGAYVYDTWRKTRITRLSSLETFVADAAEARAQGIRKRTTRQGDPTSATLPVKWR